MSSVINEVKDELQDLPDDQMVKRLSHYITHLEERLIQAKNQLQERIKTIQDVCEHEFHPVMVFDANYSPRLDDMGRGQDVFAGGKCHLCKKFESRAVGLPCIVCYKCGGAMKYDRREQFGMDSAKVYKCESCGHEHDTM